MQLATTTSMQSSLLLSTHSHTQVVPTTQAVATAAHSRTPLHSSTTASTATVNDSERVPAKASPASTEPPSITQLKYAATLESPSVKVFSPQDTLMQSHSGGGTSPGLSSTFSPAIAGGNVMSKSRRPQHAVAGLLSFEGSHSALACTSTKRCYSDEFPHCRICLDPILESELASGQAFRLGCKCASGREVMHYDCGERWFSVHGDVRCEVCGAEAVNLPPRIKHQIRWQQLMGRTRSQSMSLRAYLGSYMAFCLLPTALISLVLVLFYYKMVATDIGVTLALSILVPSATIVHWVYQPHRPVMHMWFVLTILGGVVLMTLAFLSLCPDWSPTLTVVAGALVGFAAGISAFYGILYPLYLLVRMGMGQLYTYCQDSGCCGLCGRPAGNLSRAAPPSQQLQMGGAWSNPLMEYGIGGPSAMV